MTSEREKTKTFRDVAGQAGLKKATIDKLVGEDFDTTDVIKLMTDADIEDLGVSRGQTRTLEVWVKSLRTPTPPENSSEPRPSTEDATGHNTDIFLQHEGELWDAQERNTHSDGRPLFIQDFVSRVSHDEHERAVCTQGGTQLVLRSTKQKPVPEDVTLAQWVGANARIMARMIKDGTLKSNEAILDYLDYTMDFADYAHVNDLASVMIYDHEYRRKQHRKGRKWGEDDIHLANFHLRRKSDTFRPRITPNRPPRLVDNTGVEICRNYNGNGCLRSQCVFAHVCAMCKKHGHGRRSHRDQNGNAQTSNSNRPA